MYWIATRNGSNSSWEMGLCSPGLPTQTEEDAAMATYNACIRRRGIDNVKLFVEIPIQVAAMAVIPNDPPYPVTHYCCPGDARARNRR